MRATAVQSYGGMYLSRLFEPAVVRKPRAHHIFDCDRNAAPAAARFSLGSHAVDAIRLFQRTLFRERQKCADLPVFFLNVRVVRLHQRERGSLALLHCRADGVDCE